MHFSTKSLLSTREEAIQLLRYIVYLVKKIQGKQAINELKQKNVVLVKHPKVHLRKDHHMKQAL